MATKSIAWDSGGGYIRLTYTGSGNGTISVESDANTLGTARSKTITVETTQGGAITENLTVNQAACPFPIGDVKNYDYTGNVQSVLLPAGSYKLQCWGAQGGSNGTYSSYGITAKAGGKGGYSEGVLTLISPTTVYIFVGGQGGASGNGGWNCGGGSQGTSSYNSGGTLGYTKAGCGGGATDIALTTSSMSYSNRVNNRSSASLLSRMIVAGGGSGGAMGYKAVTSQQTVSKTDTTSSFTSAGGAIKQSDGTWYTADPSSFWGAILPVPNGAKGVANAFTTDSPLTQIAFLKAIPSGTTVSYATGFTTTKYSNNTSNWGVPADANYVYVCLKYSSNYTVNSVTFSWTETETVTTTDVQGYVGRFGGGVTGGGAQGGEPNQAGGNGSFGKGGVMNQTSTRFVSGGGGAGWYGGGAYSSDSDFTAMGNGGGGSGFVNTSASASNRPSGYTGLQLDSGETHYGNETFKSPSGTNETGHSGNGYARITRLA